MTDSLITHIYIKVCGHCGLKYFGKTDDTYDYCLNTYKGSGKYWLNHINYHKSEVYTPMILSFTDRKECEEFSLWFSKENDIVNNPEWANLQIENGRDGWTKGQARPESTRAKMKASKSTQFNIKACCKICRREIAVVFLNKHRKGKMCVPVSDKVKSQIDNSIFNAFFFLTYLTKLHTHLLHNLLHLLHHYHYLLLLFP